METKKNGIKKMANISNPDFLNYINNTTNHASFEDFTNTNNLSSSLSIRINDKLMYRLKNAGKKTGISQRILVTSAISIYLEYIEKELAESLSEGYAEKK